MTISAHDLNSHYRNLAAAILYRAKMDAESGNGHSRSAKLWLQRSPWARYLLDALDLDPGAVQDWLDGLDPELQAALPGLG